MKGKTKEQKTVNVNISKLKSGKKEEEIYRINGNYV